MICYRDTTFCPGDGCANFNACSRALTPEVIARAERWWGGPDAPISRFESPKDLDCYIPANQNNAEESTKQKTTGETPEQD